MRVYLDSIFSEHSVEAPPKGLDDWPYQARLAALTGADVALWDVTQSCIRAGSLDSNIETHTLVPNDFQTFLSRHPRIDRIFFNGKTAAALFKRWVMPNLSDAQIQSLVFVGLPSTSPANARMRFEQKRDIWVEHLSEPRHQLDTSR